jgi:CDP-diacylglycerol--glycerol-3-phosphate 3-phosphatidyltransferase
MERGRGVRAESVEGVWSRLRLSWRRTLAVGDVNLVIALLVSVGSAGVLAAYAVRVANHGRVASPRLADVRGTRLLGRYPIEAFHWAASTVGRWLARAHVTPDALTLLSLGLTVLTLPLAAAGHFEAAGAVLLVGSSFDVLDGIVARELGVAGEPGEMLDSVVDRYADAACLIGLGLFYRDSVWRLGIVFVALLGSTMVSYVRAKAEKFRLSLPATTMRRAERVVYLSGALVLGPLVSRWLAPDVSGSPATMAVVAMVAALTNVAAVRLLVGARAELRRRRAPAMSSLA